MRKPTQHNWKDGRCLNCGLREPEVFDLIRCSKPKTHKHRPRKPRKTPMDPN